jgi:hypothetical protein
MLGFTFGTCHGKDRPGRGVSIIIGIHPLKASYDSIMDETQLN